MVEKNLDKITNALVLINKKTFVQYAINYLDNDYLVETSITKCGTYFALLYNDDDLIILFDNSLCYGLNFSEKEKRCVADVYSFVSNFCEWVQRKLYNLIKENSKINYHCRTGNLGMLFLEENMALFLDNLLDIRPIINNYHIKKESEDKYMC